MLIGEGVLREHDALPPVLPIVIYNGRRRWNAAAQVLLPRRFRGGKSGWLPRLEEVRTMLAEQVREWTEEWVEEGREQGIAQGRAEERALLCRQAERKFDAATARRLAAALEDVAGAGRLAEVGDWIIECGAAAELLARVSDERRRGVRGEPGALRRR